MNADETSLADLVRQVHRNYPTGVTVITTMHEGVPYGLACNAFASVSLAPPMVLFCVNQSTQTHRHLRKNSAVGINVLASDQAALAEVFAHSGADKFAQTSWHLGERGVPLVSEAAANFEATIVDTLDAGTHTVFIAQISTATKRDVEPLLYLHGSYLKPANATLA